MFARIMRGKCVHKQETVTQWSFWEDKREALAKKPFWWKLCLENEQDMEKVGLLDGDLRCSM